MLRNLTSSAQEFLGRADRNAYLAITGFVCLIALFDLGLLFLVATPADVHRILPKNLTLTYATDFALAAAGIGTQIWLSDKPRLRFVRLIAYALTLAVFVSIGLLALTWMKAS